MDFCIIVVRMYLNAQVIFCVNNFDQEWETVTVHISENFRMFFPQFGQLHSTESTVS